MTGDPPAEPGRAVPAVAAAVVDDGRVLALEDLPEMPPLDGWVRDAVGGGPATLA